MWIKKDSSQWRIYEVTPRNWIAASPPSAAPRNDATGRYFAATAKPNDEENIANLHPKGQFNSNVY